MLLLKDSPAAADVADPRHPTFAAGLLAGIAEVMKDAPGVMLRAFSHAAASAEDLNVDPLQGIFEVLQNADDLGAASVRFAVVESEAGKQLLIVHDGAPISCHHVLPMTLPYLTTKTADPDQKGRFGIGLKTLKRIADRITVHGHPYHFTADGIMLREAPPAPARPGFYEPDCDTLLVLDLNEEFDVAQLDAWFSRFDEENLIFLRSVKTFAQFDLQTGEEMVRAVRGQPWAPIFQGRPRAERQVVRGSAGSWTVLRVWVDTDEGLKRSLKATGKTVPISIALPDHDHAAGLFIGLRTRIPVNLPFSLDAPFDPSTARESLVDNAWNRWLLMRVADVICSLARHQLATDPAMAWRLVPVSRERIGNRGEAWPCDAAAAAFSNLRSELRADGKLLIDGDAVPLAQICHETEELEGFILPEDLRRLRPDSSPLSSTARGVGGRWRRVMTELAPDAAVGSRELAAGFSRGLFFDRPGSWWVEACDRLTANAPEVVFGTPCWLSDRQEGVSVSPRGETDRPLVIGGRLSLFAERWVLFSRLDDAYHEGEAGKRALAWLREEAAVVDSTDEAGELAAFAEAYQNNPQQLSDDELRELRDRFDELPARPAAAVGPSVGAALRLDGFVHRGGRRQEVLVSPNEAYLPRTLEGEHPYWPDAAGDLAGITWLSPSYDERLRTGATRASRRRADGTVSRGARKFLALLGAASSPRIVAVGHRYGGSGLRRQQLDKHGAAYVNADFTSPDLDRLLKVLPRLPRKERKLRSIALLKGLSRHWERYEHSLRTNAYKRPVKHEYFQGEVDAEWLCQLRETEWVAVGAGDLVAPRRAVVKSPVTQTLYDARSFIVGVGAGDLQENFTRCLGLITEVLASDLVGLLEAMRAGVMSHDGEQATQTYRALAKLCTGSTAGVSKIGDLLGSELRLKFSAGKGLIWVEAANAWRTPTELFAGTDIFHEPHRFVPGGSSLSRLWDALYIAPPGLADCQAFLRRCAARPYTTAVEAALIDVYRHVEKLLDDDSGVEARRKYGLRSTPVATVEGWITARPVFHVEDRELRQRLGEVRPDLRIWTPPCDAHGLPKLVRALGLTEVRPRLEVRPDANAMARGEEWTLHFQACVDHLANELARNHPRARDGIRLSWDALRNADLAVHQQPFEVRVHDEAFGDAKTTVRLDAVLQLEPPLLTVSEDGFDARAGCARVIASLFPPDVRRTIEAEWVSSWVESRQAAIERMEMASDVDLAKALADRAGSAAAAVGTKIQVTPPASRSPKAKPPRRLKQSHGPVATVTRVVGSPPKPPLPARPLATGAPANQLTAADRPTSGPIEFDRRDLEQRGWEILSQVLAASGDPGVVDLRNRTGIGADGVSNWQTFFELKATGGATQSAVEISAAEFERARERGQDFVLALVSGLEEGFRTEVRLILDPLRCVGLRLSGSVRLVGLGEAPAIVLVLDD